MKPTNLIDRAVAAIAPQYGLRRARARVSLGALERTARNYKGAGRGRRFKGWRTTSSSANTAIEGALDVLRARSHDLVRNNAYANRAVSVIQSNVVGTGILPEISTETAVGAQLEEAWKEWANTTACDADGRSDFRGLQSLIMRAIAEGGEVLVRARWRRPEDGLPIPVQLQVLEGDYLDDSKHGPSAGKDRRYMGIEFDAVGRRTGYWIHRDHPGESTLQLTTESTLVPADQVLHCYRRDRPGQHRGVPWGAPAILRLLELDRFEDAQLLRQEIAACFAAFVVDPSGDGPVEEGEFPDAIEPGMIHRMGPGQAVTLSSPPGVQNYQEFVRQVLLAIAAAYGVSYEALVGDLKGVNFSSGRMGWLEFQRNISTWQRQIMIGQFCQPVWGWFLEAARLAGRIKEPMGATWTPPRREMIDPTKEVPAQKDAVRAGFLPLSEAIRESGRDPEEVFAAMARDNAKLDELGLVLDSDARREAKSATGSDRDSSDEETSDESAKSG